MGEARRRQDEAGGRRGAPQTKGGKAQAKRTCNAATCLTPKRITYRVQDLSNHTEGQLGVAQADQPPGVVRVGEEKPRRRAFVGVVFHQARHVHLLLLVRARLRPAIRLGHGGFRRRPLHPVAVRRAYPLVLHSGNAGFRHRCVPPLPVSGEQDQVPPKRHLDHLHGRFDDCAPHVSGGAVHHLLFVRHEAVYLPFAGAAAFGDDVRVLGHGVCPVLAAFGHQQRLRQPHARLVHAVFLAVGRYLRRAKHSHRLDPNDSVFQPHHVFHVGVSRRLLRQHVVLGRHRLCWAALPWCSW